MDVRRRLVTSAAANWLAFAAALAVGFALAPYLQRELGAARYGAWCVVEAVLAYLTVLDLGVGAGLVRAAARGRAADDPAAVSRIASACLAVYAAAGGVAVLVGVPVLLAVAPTLSRSADDALPFGLVMLGNLALALPLSVFPTLLDGLERFAAKAVVRVVALVGRTAGLVAVTETSPGLLPIAGVYAVSLVLEHAALALVCRRALPGLRLSRRLVDRAAVREVRTSSTDAFLAMLAGRVTVQTGGIVLGLCLSVELTTVFSNAARLTGYAKDLLRTVTATLTPGIAGMQARGDDAGVRRLLSAATRWVLYLGLPVQLGLWCFGRPFLERWLGPAAGAAAGPAMLVLAATVGPGVAQSAAARVLYGLGELRWFARLAVAEGVLNLLLTACLVQRFGVVGVAWAVAGPNLLFAGLAIDHARRRVGLSAGEYLAEWGRPVACSVVPLVVWLSLPAGPDWGRLVVAGLAGLGPYAAAVAVAEGWVPGRRVAAGPAQAAA
jgi:O-antigen/teichoic acid export membrane protein